MSTDRELLEMAAKAAGYSLTWGGVFKVGDDIVDCSDFAYVRSREADSGDMPWDPLTDDGDALRLAVKLHIDIRHFMYRDGYMDCLVDRMGKGFAEKFTDDPYAATRRAVVRAAAEIGRATA